MKRFRWIDLALLPFGLCVLFLLLLGKLCGLTYKQISVVFNLWFQGALLTLSGVAPATSAIYKLCTGCSVWWLAAAIVLTVYATVYVFGFIQMLRHYHLPFDDAFPNALICGHTHKRVIGEVVNGFYCVNVGSDYGVLKHYLLEL